MAFQPAPPQPAPPPSARLTTPTLPTAPPASDDAAAADVTATEVRGLGPDGAPAAKTYLLLDGENIDATLGMSILGRRPAPDDRPRWDRVVSFVGQHWAQEVTSLFFINAGRGELPMAFLQALTAMRLRPVLLRGPADVKVVDVGITRTLGALRSRGGDVVLGSHDGDFLPEVEALLGDGRRVAVLAFREFLNTGYAQLVERGLEVLDLEADALAFTHPLPRMRVVDIDDFDPTDYL